MMSTPTLAVTVVAAIACMAHGAPTEVTVTVAKRSVPIHTVEDYYVSFALDNTFIRQPGVLPPDATNSTRINFTDPSLLALMPLVSGGLLRVGGT